MCGTLSLRFGVIDWRLKISDRFIVFYKRSLTLQRRHSRITPLRISPPEPGRLQGKARIGGQILRTLYDIIFRGQIIYFRFLRFLIFGNINIIYIYGIKWEAKNRLIQISLMEGKPGLIRYMEFQKCSLFFIAYFRLPAFKSKKGLSCGTIAFNNPSWRVF